MPSPPIPTPPNPDAELVWDRCGKGRIDALNALRVVAFLLVMLDHFEVAGPLAGFGLPIFLVLTGFLTTRSLLSDADSKAGLSVSGFWRRRARRMLPAAYGYVLAATALLLASDIHVNWAHFASTVLQAGNYYEAIVGPQESYLSHMWSLGLQEQYVLVWPFVILAVGRDSRRLTIVTMLAILAVWIVRFDLVLSGTSQSYMYRAFETRIDNILVGCLLALVVRRRIWAAPLGWIVRHPVATLAGSLVLLATSGSLQAHFGPVYRDTIAFIVDPIGLTTLIVLLASFSHLPVLRFTRGPALVWLGTITYGMYLYHPLAMQAVLRVSPHRGPLQVVAAFALSTLAGAASYYVIERRFLSESAPKPGSSSGTYQTLRAPSA